MTDHGLQGLQVSPAAIEDVLRTHPNVTDAAVIGVEDDVAGERPLAFVVASNSDLAGQNCKGLVTEVDEYVKSRLDETHWLRNRIWFVEELPKSQTGKTLKHKLRDAVRECALKDGSGDLNGSTPF
jgi:acyl-coenzyme A synthetase/AMP-(fatty) acid ligase